MLAKVLVWANSAEPTDDSFPRKYALTCHANCLLRMKRQTLFYRKKKKKKRKKEKNKKNISKCRLLIFFSQVLSAKQVYLTFCTRCVSYPIYVKRGFRSIYANSKDSEQPAKSFFFLRSSELFSVRRFNSFCTK